MSEIQQAFLLKCCLLEGFEDPSKEISQRSTTQFTDVNTYREERDEQSNFTLLVSHLKPSALSGSLRRQLEVIQTL